MDLSFLPKKIFTALNLCDLDKLCEVRLRVGFPVILFLEGKKNYLGDNGVSIYADKSIIIEQSDIDEIIRNVTEYSIYAFNEKIKKGFLTTKGGVRIGLAGECVFENGKIITIKNFTSLNIRIPHEVLGCASGILPYLLKGERVFNALIISPPFFGKTTVLKDIVRNLDEKGFLDILLVDERGEFCDIKGENIDKISFCDKNYAFEYAIRSLAPKIIVTDELVGQADWDNVFNAVSCGVKVIASCHSDSVENVIKKECFLKGVFERYVVLSDKKSTYKIYDGDFNEL